MSSNVIDNNEARVPFLGDKMSYTSGLDPLGLQNPSSQAYAFLLPGLNNVTGHIRSYSFYCWLLQEYAYRIKSENPKEQQKFIRRSEYILALVAVFSNIEGISGSNYATARKNEGLKEFDLETGTYNLDGTTVKTYWQYYFGVFGQYYVGSMRQIGLIEEPVDQNGNFLGIFRRTANSESLKVSGHALAEAFDKQISSGNKKLLFNCIEKGIITIKELNDLSIEFNLTIIDSASNERELLSTLLLEKDQPGVLSDVMTTMRRDTLLHVLNYIKSENESFNQRLFTKFAYAAKGKIDSQSDESLIGWYYYQLNEYFQVACTAMLNGLLAYLHQVAGLHWISLPELISKCKNEIMKELEKNRYINSANQQMNNLTFIHRLEEATIFTDIMNTTQIARITSGFILLIKLYFSNFSEFNILREFTSRRRIGDEDDVLTFYSSYIGKQNMTVNDFLNRLILINILERHQYVAYRKMVGIKSTQKFIIEDNFIRYIENFEPGYTSPRLNTLISFLFDLGFVNDQYKITRYGTEMLNKND